jgi:exodeoxyribonuclease III
MSMFRIATWNVNSLRVRLPQALQWLRSEQPDVLALQETKLEDANFPLDEILAAGYQAVFSGQKTYNGVATLSKRRASNILMEIPGYADTQRRILFAEINGISVLNLYAPNGSEVGSDKYAYKLEWFSHLQPFVRELLYRNCNLIVLGDFNIAPEDRDVHDPAEWDGKVLVSGPERAEFRKLLDQGFVDSFRLFEQEAQSFSWWDYRAASFRRNRGLRIDHILSSRALAACCTSCRIDRRPRGLEKPSDHTPVIAEFSF